MTTMDIHTPLLRSRGPGAQKKSMVGLLRGEGEGWGHPCNASQAMPKFWTLLEGRMKEDEIVEVVLG